MASTRIVLGIVVTAASSVFALVACSGSTTSTTTGGDGGTSSSSASSSSSGGATTKLKSCPSSTTSTCTDAEQQTYGNCLADKCDANFQQCYGSDYRNGNFGGACGTYITCTNACACGDTACTMKCGTPDQACTSCLSGFSACSAMCTAPACETAGSSGSSGSSGTSGSSGGATHTCADLAACCAKISDASTKMSCDTVYNSLNPNDANCNAVYSGYAPSCP